MYFKTPHHSVVFNAKVGSSSLARTIVETFYPDVERKIQSAAYPKDKGPDNTQWQCVVPNESMPTQPVVMLVRDPVERFESAMTQFRLTNADAVLDAMENSTSTPGPHSRPIMLRGNPHFVTQSSLIPLRGEVVRLYRFPDHLEAFAAEVGLPYPLSKINESTAGKLVLTQPQVDRVARYYAEDQALFASITTPGTSYLPPKAVEYLRQQALAEVRANYDMTLAAGICPEGFDITLPAGEADRTRLFQLLTLVHEAEAQTPQKQRKAFGKTEQTIVDIDGKPHALTVDILRSLLLAYGLKIQAHWTECASKSATVHAATTVKEIIAARQGVGNE